MATLNAERFYQRLERLQQSWLSQRGSLWAAADCLVILFGNSDENIYSKPAALHLYLFGYEDFTDSVIIITKGNFHFLSSAKKCSVLQQQLDGKGEGLTLTFTEKSKDETTNVDNFNRVFSSLKRNGVKAIGTLIKDKPETSFLTKFAEVMDESQLEKVDITAALGLFFAIKDETELDSCKRAAVLSNKVMKHGFIQEMETIFDQDKKISHLEIAKKVEAIITDPSKISLNVSADSVDSCYEPIIQSGGVYDIRINATSTKDLLTPNVIICSLGARYKGYCSTVARTFLVDAPPKVVKMYKTLLALFLRCLEQMVKGNQLKDVYEGAKSYLTAKDPNLLQHLPKTLGFAMGLEFRDATMVLNQTNTTKFVPNMVFNLSVGFHNIPLSEEDVKDAPEAVKKLSTFSLLMSDMVVIQNEGVADILTKVSKEFGGISYEIGDDKDGDKGGKDNDEDGGDDNMEVDEDGNVVRRTVRNRQERIANEQLTKNRLVRQEEIFKKKAEEGKLLQARGALGAEQKVAEVVVAKDLAVYRSPDEYPRDLPPNRLKIDAEKEVLFIPINGRHVPFHITAIKNITYTDPDMRITFYSAGSALGKEINPNMRALIAKYHDEAYTFIKEMTFRSPDPRNLSSVFQQYQDLRKKIRQRDQKAEQEKGLVEQAKLIRIKDQRVPRLQEVTMRPPLSGRKSIGALEAHQNGLRFTSSKAETLDILYDNIKHAIYQPCDKTAMVLVHFHLKDMIMVNKKKQKDIQFFTEAVDSSLNLDSARRYGFDPDEIEDEQREREMRRRLNQAFKEFCSKVEKVAAHHDFNVPFDAPYKKSGFFGTWSKEMVNILPTAHCLVNLTEWPPLVITLSEIDHVHFERVSFGTNNFDVTFIFKDWSILPRTIVAVDIKFMDTILDWLNEVELTFTRGGLPVKWSEMMKLAMEQRDTFYDSTDEDGQKKPVAWKFLSGEGSDDEDEGEEEEESSYSGSEKESDEESDDDEDDSELEDEDEEDSDEYEDEEDELEEKGMTWDELERDAIARDNKREREEEVSDARGSSKNARRR